MKNPKTETALFVSAVSMLLCIAMLVSTTFAWFTDSASSGLNDIRAGNLQVDLEMLSSSGRWESADGQTISFQKAGGAANGEPVIWEPGCTYVLPQLRVINKGSLAVKYRITIDGIAGSASLNEVIDWTINDAPLSLAEMTLAAQTAGDSFTIKGHMQDTAGDQYQGLEIDDIKISVVATQAADESDSFDNQYDSGAHFDAAFGRQILDKMKDTAVATIVAGQDIDLGVVTFQGNTVGNATFDMVSGKTLDLNRNSMIRPDSGSGNGLAFANGVAATVKNGTVVNEGDLTAVDISYGATATFERVTFNGHGDSMIRVRASGQGGKATAIFRNCTFNNAGIELSGMNGASEVDIRFINCTFTGSYYMYDENGNRLTDPYGHVHYTNKLISATSNYLCGSILIDNCTFAYDARESTNARSVIELYGCNQSSYPGKMLNVTLKDVSIRAQKAVPVLINSSYQAGLDLHEEGTNSYTLNDVAVTYAGQPIS